MTDRNRQKAKGSIIELSVFKCRTQTSKYKEAFLSGLCEDLDECAQGICGLKKCQNTPGSYKCQATIADWTFRLEKFRNKRIETGGRPPSGGYRFEIREDRMWRTNGHHSFDCGKFSGEKVSFVSLTS